MVVKSELKKLGLHYSRLDLGEVDINEHVSEAKHDALKAALLKSGLELMDDKKAVLIEKIKTVVIELIHYTDELPKTNFSKYLSEKLDLHYTYLSNLFSEVMGTTIEQFIIMHKIERVKELLVYNELTLSEIAWKLHYSSVSHLSNQFKKVTGLTPSFFRKIKHKRLHALESLGEVASNSKALKVGK